MPRVASSTTFWGVGRAGFNLPGYADGTNFARGGLARINEKGGEIIDLPRGSRVIPRDVSMAMARNDNSAGDGGLTVNIHNTNESKVETRAGRGADGRRELEVFIFDTVRDGHRRGAFGF